MKKQSSGNVAPPTTPTTPVPFAPTPTLYAMSAAFERANPPPTMDVPDFTPLSRFRKSLSRPVLPLRVVENAPFEDLTPADAENQIRVPPTLLAPRYSHLLEEATAFGQHDPTAVLRPDDDKEARNQQPEGMTFPINSGEASAADDSAEFHVALRADQPSTSRIETANKRVTTTLSNRVKGFFASYLPTLSDHSKSRQKSLKATQPGLPLPPPSVLEKSRGPISTPIRPPVPRVPHPKELVHLNPAPLPPSHIPRAKAVPKRLVELVPVLPPPQEPKEFKTILVPRPRRSSGNSVKDLVRGFEQMEKITVDEIQPRKTGNIENLRSWRQCEVSKPKWKP